MILGRRKSVDTPPRSLLHSLFPGLPLPHAAGRRRDLRRPICQPRSSFRLLEKSESLADDQVSLQPERDHVSYVHSNACRICCWFPRRRHVSCDCQICLRLLPPSLWFARQSTRLARGAGTNDVRQTFENPATTCLSTLHGTFTIYTVHTKVI